MRVEAVVPARRPGLGRAALCAVALSLIAGCSSESGGSETSTGSDVYRAIVREETGEIVLPLEQFTLSHQERQTVNHARRLLTAECMAKAGYDWPQIDLRGEPPMINLRYGIFGESIAARYGYKGRPESPQVDELIQFNSRELSVGEQAALESCSEAPQLAQLRWEDPTPGDLAAFGIHAEIVENTPEGRAAIDDWRACLDRQGISVDDDEWIPSGVGPDLDENHLRIAVTDARCKRETELVETLAELEAAEQAEIIRANEVALVEQRRQAAEVVARAEEVIAGSGG